MAERRMLRLYLRGWLLVRCEASYHSHSLQAKVDGWWFSLSEQGRNEVYQRLGNSFCIEDYWRIQLFIRAKAAMERCRYSSSELVELIEAEEG